MERKHGITLSVIVPAYNTKKYLRRCLDSLWVQSITGLEIIVIDDNSDEDLREIMAYYSNTNGKSIRYEWLPQRRGPGGARNRGLELAQGRYVAFCDSDDWVDITYYETCVTAMEKRSADLAMCSLLRSYDFIQDPPRYKCRYNQEISISGDIALKVLTKQLDLGFLIIPSSVNKVYRKDYLSQIGLSFVENTMFEDLLFSFVAVMNAPKVLCIPDVSYHHYKRPNSIVQSFDRKHIEDFAHVFTLLRQYLKAEKRYEEYRFLYYSYLEQFYNLIVREIFEFVLDEPRQKEYLAYSFQHIKELIDFREYMDYTTAEQLRRHIQPHISDTTIY